LADGKFAKVVHDPIVRAILLIDLEYATVLGVAGGENARRLAGQENPRVSTMAVG
jgi:hypothetical protein